MENVTKNAASGVKDIITTGQNNQKGLIGTIALSTIAIAALAIKAISGK